MDNLSAVPDWLGTAVLGAVIAALGYVVKLIGESVQAWRRRRAAEVTSLLRLASLLKASRAVFGSQRLLVVRLKRLVDARLPTAARPGQGYERQFSEAFASFTAEELEIHRLIRSYTEHGLRPLNLSIGDWLDADVVYRNARDMATPRGRLAAGLNQLDTHLRLWHAKYAAWIPNYAEHALVYLADEDDHGLGFPRGLDALVAEVLATLGTSFAAAAGQQREPARGA